MPGCIRCRVLEAEIERLKAELEEKPSRKKAFLEGAVRVYEYYAKILKPARRQDSIRVISRVMKEGATEEVLMAAAENALASYRKEGRDAQYYPHPHNFYGHGIWEDFATRPRREMGDGRRYVYDIAGTKRYLD